MKKYTELIIIITTFAAYLLLLKENKNLRSRLEEQTDKHWECNRQIALYDDEIKKLRKQMK